MGPNAGLCSIPQWSAQKILKNEFCNDSVLGGHLERLRKFVGMLMGGTIMFLGDLKKLTEKAINQLEVRLVSRK